MKAEPQTDTDVLVVGAGPVGLTLAAELLRHGVRARIVDMNDGPSVWSKAAVVHARTLEAMEAMGIADEAVARGRKLHALGFYHGEERVGHVSVDGLDSPYPFMLGLSQRETELLLDEHLRALGGKVERRVELGSFSQTDGGDDGAGPSVRARLIHDQRSEEIRVPWLVGCDGAHSVVRKTLEIPFDGGTYEEHVLQADIRIRWAFAAPPDEGLFFVTPRGAMAALPLLGEGRYRLLFLLAPEEDYDPTIENLRLLMDERGPAGTVLEDPAWMVAFRFQHRIVPHYRVRRIFLAGDAAHVHSPIGGQGMNMGMIDAVNLAWKLALVIRRKGRHTLLDSYEAERRPVAQATVAITDAATRYAARALGLQSPLAQRLRDQLFGLASRLPLIEARAAAILGGLALDYRSSPAVGQYVAPLLPAGVATTAGALIDRATFEQGPGPGARVGDLDLFIPFEGKHRLFEILHGTAHTLLLFASHAEAADGHRALGQLARAVRARFAEVVHTLVVAPWTAPPPDLGWDGSVLHDPSGSIHTRFGARAASAYLVRPDGHVAYRCQPPDEERLMAYLGSIFTG